MPDLPKSYIAKEHETHIYDMWLKSGAFKPSKTGDNFSILMPPPNANESLHVGHALMVTVEDVMIRHARMNGKSANWIPGTDHAGFETQVVYEKKLQKEDKSRFDFTPDQLRSNIREYVMQQQETILSQIKSLGASCNWDSLYFTLDQNIIDVAYQTFYKMNSDKLLYRAKRLVNYCVKHGTSFSDLEVEYEDVQGTLTYIKYPIKNEKDAFIKVATTRPETMLGDTAVAVSPNGKHKSLIGKIAIIPLIDREIPIIGDDAVLDQYGSGCVKVTPAHSHIDAEIATRHKLPTIEVIDNRGKMMGDIPKDLIGLKSAEARTKIVEELKKLNLIEKEDLINHRIGVCYKCKTPIEILPIEQWWVSTKPLAKKAIEAINKNQITITPKESKRNIVTWLENIIDWNISRQIVWGIPIPAWYKKHEAWSLEHGADTNKSIGDEIKVQVESPGKDWVQDKDTFDTWFSSTQLPFAALGYPNSETYKNHFPTSVMETGADILYFWVARMIMMSLYVTGEVPFKHIYLHGLVLDAQGKKMSKSKGNVVDPITLMDQYGTDALRWAVIHGTTAGQNFNMTLDRVIGGRNFANKIWNAARYVLTNGEQLTVNSEYRTENTEQRSDAALQSSQLDQLDKYDQSETVNKEQAEHSCDVNLTQSAVPFRSFMRRRVGTSEVCERKGRTENKDQRTKIKEQKSETIKENFNIENCKLKTCGELVESIENSSNKSILIKLSKLITDVNKAFATNQYGFATDLIFDFFWHEFCDKYIEESKSLLKSPQTAPETQLTLLTCITSSLKLLHPFMPFVTETIWQEFVNSKLVDEKLLILAKWPK
jgi:valyl-tRNA synthetase